MPVIQSYAHPELDAALLHFDDNGVCNDFLPLTVNTLPAGPEWIGMRVELAGYGLSELGDRRELNFVVESIALVEPTELVVDGKGRSGACTGDSGGPLLLRGPDGAPLIFGVLASGARSCVGQDRLVRGDTLAQWIRTTTGGSEVSGGECGDITAEGACAFGAALWCSEGILRSASCGAGIACGWDSAASGFRCVDPARDSCRGVGRNGVCEGNEAVSCVSGALERSNCGALGDFRCVYSPSTGSPTCVAP